MFCAHLWRGGKNGIDLNMYAAMCISGLQSQLESFHPECHYYMHHLCGQSPTGHCLCAQLVLYTKAICIYLDPLWCESSAGKGNVYLSHPPKRAQPVVLEDTGLLFVHIQRVRSYTVPKFSPVLSTSPAFSSAQLYTINLILKTELNSLRPFSSSSIEDKCS